MGFTVVDVNMRGTGCSGGAYDFFEPLQNLDGYDVIETVARQPWVLHHKVGMMGISYGGISQLFTAATDPPSLAAISPLSVIDQTQTTLYPGGHPQHRLRRRLGEGARSTTPCPASAHRRPALRPTSRSRAATRPARRTRRSTARRSTCSRRSARTATTAPKVADPLSPITFVNKIKVPVFMACQFTDEQTGGHCPTLAEHMTGTRRKWFTFTNGAHIDSLDPATLNRWYDFLELYVAQQSPIASSAMIHAGAPRHLPAGDGRSTASRSRPTRSSSSRPTPAPWPRSRRCQPIRVLFDNGAGRLDGRRAATRLRALLRRASRSPARRPQTWYLAPRGALAARKPARARAPTRSPGTRTPAADRLQRRHADGHRTACGPRRRPTTGSRPPAGSAVSYLTAPLAANTTVIGAGAVHVWVRASARTSTCRRRSARSGRTARRPSSRTAGCAATSASSMRRRARPLEPVLSLRKGRLAAADAGASSQVTIPLYYEGHAYRAGSRIRVTITRAERRPADLGVQQTQPKGNANVTIAFSKKRPPG